MIKQISRFGIIGAIAAAVHFISVVAVVQYFNISPLIANIIAFLIAFNVSYFGHRYWTFDSGVNESQAMMRKFFIVAVFSFGLNQFLFYVLLKFAHIYYPLALFVVLMAVPPLTFVLSKTWAFKNKRSGV